MRLLVLEQLDWSELQRLSPQVFNTELLQSVCDGVRHVPTMLSELHRCELQQPLSQRHW